MSYTSIQGVLISESTFFGTHPPIVVEDRTPGARNFLADRHSQAVEEIVAAWPKHWINGFYERLCEVLEMNRDYILGDDGMAAHAETEGDRRVARAVAAGAKMDPQTGAIPGAD